MSCRALRRKLQEQEQLENKKNDVVEEIDEEEESIIPTKPFNRFDLLIGASLSESEAKEDDGLAESYEKDYNKDKNATGLNNASGARKKKRKKKKKGHVKYPASSEDQMDLDCDEVERSVREVNALLGEVASIPANIDDEMDNKKGTNLLLVEHKYLNPQNEMKRIFGAKVVQATESHKKRTTGNTRGSSRLNRGTWIVQGQSHWNQHSKPGISMVLLESTPTHHNFKIQHSLSYQQAQYKFLDAVGSLNPDNMLALLQSEPFHVDTLLQVAEIFHLADDASMSAQLIERALYVLESIAHPIFNVTQGNCRLQYKQQENRCFFIALFRHILNVGLKGCYRTALELCKVLLNLSPNDDPLAVSLMLDFYAIRAKEYAWLIALYDLYEPSKNLSMLPNFSFSVPLAYFHLSRIENGSSNASHEKTERGKKYFIFKNLGSSEEMRKTADSMLLRTILMFPGAIKPLLNKCNIQPDVNIDEHPYFGIVAQESMSEGLKQIVNLFIGRNYHLWKEPEVIVWLEGVFKTALEKYEQKDDLVTESENQRKLRYQGTPSAIFRHIIMSEIKDATATLPPAMANTPLMSYDPLPPPDTMCDYTRPIVPGHPSAASSSSTILASFFRGLMPSYDPATAHLHETLQEGVDTMEAAAEVEGHGTELRESVTTLLEAMRNLFRNINTMNEAGGEDADQSEDDTEHWE